MTLTGGPRVSWYEFTLCSLTSFWIGPKATSLAYLHIIKHCVCSIEVKSYICTKWMIKNCKPRFVSKWVIVKHGPYSQCDSTDLFSQVFSCLASTGAPFCSQGDLRPALLLHGHHYRPQPHLWCHHWYICWPEEWEAEKRGNTEDNMFYLR